MTSSAEVSLVFKLLAGPADEADAGSSEECEVPGTKARGCWLRFSKALRKRGFRGASGLRGDPGGGASGEELLLLAGLECLGCRKLRKASDVR